MRHEFSSVVEGSSKNTSRPFIQIPGLWLKVHKMNEPFLTRELSRASGTNVLLGVLILAGILTVYHLMGLGRIGDEISTNTSIILSISSSLLRGAVGSIRFVFTVGLALFGYLVPVYPLWGVLFGTVIAYYVSTGITFRVATLLGGKGTYGGQSYLQSLFFVPITGVCALLTFIPYAGPFISLALSLYAFVLHIRAIKVSHRLSTGRAIGALAVLILVVAPFDVMLTLLIRAVSQIPILSGTP